MKLAVMFDNLGPYHIARLAAAAQRLDLFAVETYASSAEYAWKPSRAHLPFERSTLFELGTSPTFDVLRRRVFDVLEGSRPDAVAIAGYSTRASLIALAWCGRNNIPAICMSESHALDAPRISYREFIKRRLLRNFSAALVGGSRHRDYFVGLGMPADRIFTGYDVVDNHYFSANAVEIRSRGADPRLRAELPDNYFLASSRFIPKKNLRRLIEAFAQFLNRLANESNSSTGGGKNWKLVVLGDGPLRGELEATIHRLHIEDHVLLRGFVQYDSLPTYYASAFAFVHVSVVEQWGLVINEAMASGLPVIVSRPCGCVPDLAIDNLNGYTVDPMDSRSIADRLHTMASNSNLREAMALQSETIIKDWGLDRFTDSLLGAAELARLSRREVSLLDSALARILARR